MAPATGNLRLWTGLLFDLVDRGCGTGCRESRVFDRPDRFPVHVELHSFRKDPLANCTNSICTREFTHIPVQNGLCQRDASCWRMKTQKNMYIHTFQVPFRT